MKAEIKALDDGIRALDKEVAREMGEPAGVYFLRDRALWSPVPTEVSCAPKWRKACLFLFFNTNTNCENMAYRSLRSEKCSARGVRKVTTGN